MRYVVTASEMREIDRRTIEEVGIPGLILMENAGLGVVEAVLDLLKDIHDGRVVVFCGKGNNGGDGMVVARHLFNRGIDVDIYLTGKKNSLQGDALANMNILDGFNLKINELTDKKGLTRIGQFDLIVDALLGTGITGEVKGLAADVIHWINVRSEPVVSVDLPSGLHSDTGFFSGACVKADYTVTMAELKRGLLVPPGREMAGNVSVVDIGSPRFVSDSIGIKTYRIDDSDAADRLPHRSPAGHKGDFGKVLILAGSPGMTGAAVLSAHAALASGCGLTILGAPESLNPILEKKLTEVMTKPLPETASGSLSLDSEKEINQLLDWADVLAIGPGLSRDSETEELIHRIVTKTRLPVVVDADGLNAFAGQVDLLEKKKGKFILTPHMGELARIIGKSIEDISNNPIETAREWASRLNCILVLKGAPTIIGDSDGYVYVNSTGNAGMATAGSGDVLTGMIAGFLGQGSSPLDAALCGVFYHGRSGDLAVKEIGERSLIAGNLIDFLPAALDRNLK